MVRKKTLQLLLCDYQWTARYYTIYRTFKQWSSDDFTTILRLFVGRNYDYSRSCYDYSSRNATTIADLYWLSGESPKRDTAEPSMVPRRCARKKAQYQANARLTRCQANARRGKHRDPAGLAWLVVCCTGWHGSITGAQLHLIYLIIIGQLRWPVQRPGVAQAAYRRLVWLLYCVRWNRANQRKSRCKAL